MSRLGPSEPRQDTNPAGPLGHRFSCLILHGCTRPAFDRIGSCTGVFVRPRSAAADYCEQEDRRQSDQGQHNASSFNSRRVTAQSAIERIAARTAPQRVVNFAPTAARIDRAGWLPRLRHDPDVGLRRLPALRILLPATASRHTLSGPVTVSRRVISDKLTVSIGR